MCVCAVLVLFLGSNIPFPLPPCWGWAAGAGTSRLVHSLASARPRHAFLSTDASPVSVRLSESLPPRPNLSHTVLDVLDPASPPPGAPFAAVLDKGCLDTFLYRLPLNDRVPAALKCLRSVRGWLEEGGRYVVISPRRVLPCLRDFVGFSGYERRALEKGMYGGGDLDGGRKQGCVYMHTCIRGVGEVDGAGGWFRGDGEDEPEVCGKCGRERGGGGRKWKNHVRHCKG